MVGVGFSGGVVDALGVEGVEADHAGGVDDVAVAGGYADVDDFAFGVVEEGQVAAADVAYFHGGANCGLLGGVAGETDSALAEDHLNQTRAVDARLGAATPEVGCAQELHGSLHGVFEVAHCRFCWGEGRWTQLDVADPAFVAVVEGADEEPIGLFVEDFDGVAVEELVDHLGAVAGLKAHGDGREETGGIFHGRGIWARLD